MAERSYAWFYAVIFNVANISSGAIIIIVYVALLSACTAYLIMFTKQ